MKTLPSSTVVPAPICNCAFDEVFTYFGGCYFSTFGERRATGGLKIQFFGESKLCLLHYGLSG